MRFIITEMALGDRLREHEQVLPFGTTTVQALAVLNQRFLECLDNYDSDGRKRWCTISIAPDDDPVFLPEEESP